MAVFPEPSVFNYDNIFYDICTLLQYDDTIIKQFSKQDYYLYCIYFPIFFNKAFVKHELVQTTDLKLKPLPYDVAYQTNTIKKTYEAYRNHFAACLKQLTYFERTLYDLLFSIYNIFFENNLNIIYHNEELKSFLLREKFFDILYPFISIIYNLYGQDYWIRAQNRSIDTFMYFVYFEPYFTNEMYNALITKLIWYYSKLYKRNKKLYRTTLISNYINNSTCPEEYKHEFNSRCLLYEL